jgi:chorismate mutase
MSVRAIRGATQVGSNSADAITAGTQELVSEILRSNGITSQNVISILFTASAMERTIRVMAHVEIERKKEEITHIYLHGAKALRADIAQ